MLSDRSIVLFSALASLLAAAVARPSDAPAIDAALRQTIEALNRQIVDAVLRGDPRAAARFYTRNAVLLGPRGQKLVGRAAIEGFFAAQKGMKAWQVDVLELGGTGDLVYQLGHSVSSWVDEKGQTGSYSCDFVYLWQRQPDGSYQIHIDSYN